MDTLKLVYTQLEVFNLVEEYTEAYKNKIKELEKENRSLKKEKGRIRQRLVALEKNLETLSRVKENKELREENKKLKSDLSECECSFGFENDEVGFWKGEYKRLKKWIKDHCKGYGNLFPEDEMKRQWKKADKKRK